MTEKRYKPGQFVSLGGKLYRVKRAKSKPLMVFACAACNHKCIGNDKLYTDCIEKLPGRYYPVEVKPKRQG